jgi:O-methyltransferase
MERLGLELRRRGLVRWLVEKRRQAVRRVLAPFGRELQRRGATRFPEATRRELQLIEKYAPYTMTGETAQWALLRAVKYLDDRGIPGDLVECGVWRGGNLMMVKEFRQESSIPRRYFLFDTFAGMTAPTAVDIGQHGEAASRIFDRRQKDGYNDWAYASLEEVTGGFREHGLLDDSVVFRKGSVETTLRQSGLPEEIALLRLDTDWYESTRIELEVLYPRLSHAGVLVIDDYGSWEGARKATDEYFSRQPLLLNAVDNACRVAVKA